MIRAAHDVYNGKFLHYEEIFKSPFEKNTRKEAEKVLEKIRESHPACCGWLELSGEVVQLPNGKWIAIRHHAQYK